MVLVQVALLTLTVFPTGGGCLWHRACAICISPNHIVDPLLCLTLFVEPTFDDLNSIEITTNAVLQCRYEKGWKVCRLEHCRDRLPWVLPSYNPPPQAADFEHLPE